MTELSIQLNGLRVGSSQLDDQQISPIHKKRAEECLSTFFSKQIRADGQKIPFHLRLEAGKPLLTLDGRKITLEQTPELEPLNRIIRFYQHTGHLPREKLTLQQTEVREEATKKAVRALQDPNVNATNSQILAGMRIAEDTLSLTRNILFAIPSIGPDDPVVNHLGYYAGIFWTIFAVKEFNSGMDEYSHAKLIHDDEGQRRATARLLSGSIVVTASLTYLSGKILDTLTASSVAEAAIGSADVLFGVGSLLAMGISALSAYRCHTFNERLNEYLENPKLTEVEKLKGALQFLKDAISVTPEERDDLIAKIEKDHPEWTPEQKNQQLDQELKDLTEVKVKYLKRRTSGRSLLLILSQADKLLAKLNNEETAHEGIKEATIMLHTIQRDVKTKMALFILGFIAALISFMAMVTGTVFTAGALPFILYGIAGTIYLAMTVYSVALTFFNKDPDNKEIDLHPMQDLGSHEVNTSMFR